MYASLIRSSACRSMVGAMAQYATCECYYCHQRVPKSDAHYCGTAERESGRSGGSFRFYNFGKRGGIGYAMGRKYYTNQDIWICNDCYPRYEADQRQQRWRGPLRGIAVVIGFLIIVEILHFGPKSNSQSISTGNAGLTESSLPSKDRIIGLRFCRQCRHWFNRQRRHKVLLWHLNSERPHLNRAHHRTAELNNLLHYNDHGFREECG